MHSRLSTPERSKTDGIARCDVKMLAHTTNTKKASSNYLFPANSVKIKLKLESVRSEMTLVLMHFQ